MEVIFSDSKRTVYENIGNDRIINIVTKARDENLKISEKLFEKIK